MARKKLTEAEMVSKIMETAKAIAIGTDGEGKAQDFMEGENISNVSTALAYMFNQLKNSIRRAVGLSAPSANTGGDTFSQHAASLTKPHQGADTFSQYAATKTVPPFFTRVYQGLTNMLSKSAKAVVNLPETMNTVITPGKSLTYGNVIRVGFFGSLICFGIYKLVKWVRTKKTEEKDVQELNANCGEFKNKLIEGMDFINVLTQKLSEGQTATAQEAVTSINKADGVAKELASFSVEAENTAKEKSFIRRFGYYILGGIAALAAIYVYGSKAAAGYVITNAGVVDDAGTPITPVPGAGR